MEAQRGPLTPQLQCHRHKHSCVGLAASPSSKSDISTAPSSLSGRQRQRRPRYRPTWTFVMSPQADRLLKTQAWKHRASSSGHFSAPTTWSSPNKPGASRQKGPRPLTSTIPQRFITQRKQAGAGRFTVNMKKLRGWLAQEYRM